MVLRYRHVDMIMSAWLSLERPYKDDSGNPIPTIYDLTPQGEFIYEPFVPLTFPCYPI